MSHAEITKITLDKVGDSFFAIVAQKQPLPIKSRVLEGIMYASGSEKLGLDELEAFTLKYPQTAAALDLE